MALVPSHFANVSVTLDCYFSIFRWGVLKNKQLGAVSHVKFQLLERQRQGGSWFKATGDRQSQQDPS
jgi:hypothetical protein